MTHFGSCESHLFDHKNIVNYYDESYNCKVDCLVLND